MYDKSISMFYACVLPLPPPLSNVGIGVHMPLIHSQYTILDNIDFGERGTEFLLQNAWACAGFVTAGC